MAMLACTVVRQVPTRSTSVVGMLVQVLMPTGTSTLASLPKPRYWLRRHFNLPSMRLRTVL
jgi:hypothetical protein